MTDGFARTYTAALLFDHSPRIIKADLLAALRRRCGTVEPLDGIATSDQLSFIYPDHPVMFSDGSIPTQTFMALAPQCPNGERVEASLAQSWDWPDAREAVSRTKSTLLVSDLMSSGLDYKERLALFQNAVSAVMDVIPCLGMHWVPSERFIAMSAYVESKRPETYDGIFPSVNVRLFRITDRGGQETLMDTLGLAALGIPDLQCHFGGLEPGAVARMLYNTAGYLFEHGDVIGDGETISGIRTEDRWRCQHEDALAGPERAVLDINPGKPHAAGNRA